MQGLVERIAEAREFIRARWDVLPRAGLILGTGLGDLSRRIEAEIEIPYAEVPHFPHSTVRSHAGQLVCGLLEGVPIVAMEGRFHYYEGWSLGQVTFPVRVMRALGADILVTTNAAGGMHPDFELADIVVVDDHIDLMPENPLRGVNDDALGPRFPDMSRPYDTELIAAALAAAREENLPVRTGVLVAVPGPNLETRAEYRMLRMMGADVVSMSTVPEIIVANHAGMRCLAFSIVTDLCDPEHLEPADIERIIAVAGVGGDRLGRLIPRIFRGIRDGSPS
ncbi:MAG: purine-nucleoside phosphorylase [Planctomycetaceae bacterium]